MIKNRLLIPCCLEVLIFCLNVLFVRILHFESLAFIFTLLGFVCMVTGLICNITYAVSAVKNGWTFEKLSKANLIVKSVRLPMIIGWTINVTSGMDGYMTAQSLNGIHSYIIFGVIMMFMLVILVIYACAGTGAIAVACVIRGQEEKVLSGKKIMICKIGSFGPFFDIAIAIWIWQNVKNIESGYLQ